MSNYATGPNGGTIRLEIVEGLNCPDCGGSLGGEMWVNEDVFICVDCSKEYNIQIEITQAQKEELDEKKQHERESYKSVIGRLLDGDVGDLGPHGGEVPPGIKNMMEMGDSEIEDRLDRLEEAIKEATNAAQSADRKLEELR